ncbi:three-Cys-motif partner protein TcmP [Chloroflexota bacterium]
MFSGPGRCAVETTKDEICGSPIIALNCEIPFTNYFYNDNNPNFIKALNSRVLKCDFATVKLFNKDCNLVIEDLLKELPSGALYFCFIDPLNWEINFNSIQRLTESKQMDLLITFHIGNMKRDAEFPPQELLDFFPPLDWQELYIKAHKGNRLNERIFQDAYINGLKKIGYKVIRDHLFTTNINNTLLYYLIFASKHERGAYFFDEVTKRSKAGQMRMKIV